MGEPEDERDLGLAAVPAFGGLVGGEPAALLLVEPAGEEDHPSVAAPRGGVVLGAGGAGAGTWRIHGGLHAAFAQLSISCLHRTKSERLFPRRR